MKLLSEKNFAKTPFWQEVGKHKRRRDCRQLIQHTAGLRDHHFAHLTLTLAYRNFKKTFFIGEKICASYIRLFS